MNPKTILLALCLSGLGCGGDDEDDNGCYFEGRYDVGFVARTMGCESAVETLIGVGEREECSQPIDQISLDGSRQLGVVSCEPGNPVIECEGFMNDANGCSYDVYVRRIR